MFSVAFHQDFAWGSVDQNITNIARLVSFEGFDALNYSVSVDQKGGLVFPSTFEFKMPSFSIVFFVQGETPSVFNSRMFQIINVFRQYKASIWSHRFVFTNIQTNKVFQAPVIIEEVSFQQQTGLSAVVVVKGIRRTQGLFVGNMFVPSEVEETTNNLPKTVTIAYPHSFPSPLRLTLTGPINAGVQITRNEGFPVFDFSLSVGTNIPSGTIVVIDYLTLPLNDFLPVYNGHYLSNPEVASTITIRPQTVGGNANNVFTISGPPSGGKIKFEVYNMVWSVYE